MALPSGPANPRAASAAGVAIRVTDDNRRAHDDRPMLPLWLRNDRTSGSCTGVECVADRATHTHTQNHDIAVSAHDGEYNLLEPNRRVQCKRVLTSSPFGASPVFRGISRAEPLFIYS